MTGFSRTTSPNRLPNAVAATHCFAVQAAKDRPHHERFPIMSAFFTGVSLITEKLKKNYKRLLRIAETLGNPHCKIRTSL